MEGWRKKKGGRCWRSAPSIPPSVHPAEGSHVLGHLVGLDAHGEARADVAEHGQQDGGGDDGPRREAAAAGRGGGRVGQAVGGEGAGREAGRALERGVRRGGEAAELVAAVELVLALEAELEAERVDLQHLGARGVVDQGFQPLEKRLARVVAVVARQLERPREPRLLFGPLGRQQRLVQKRHERERRVVHVGRRDAGLARGALGAHEQVGDAAPEHVGAAAWAAGAELHDQREDGRERLGETRRDLVEAHSGRRFHADGSGRVLRERVEVERALVGFFGGTVGRHGVGDGSGVVGA